MGNNEYDIDDILLEAQHLRDRARAGNKEDHVETKDKGHSIDALKNAESIVDDILEEQAYAAAQHKGKEANKKKAPSAEKPKTEKENNAKTSKPISFRRILEETAELETSELIEEYSRTAELRKAEIEKAQRAAVVNSEEIKEPKKEKFSFFDRRKKEKAQDQEKSSYLGFDDKPMPPLDTSVHSIEDIETKEDSGFFESQEELRAAAANQTQEGTSRKVEQKGEKVDLFEFQPEKRKGPIRSGPFGKKHFDFQKPAPYRTQQIPPISPLINQETGAFDFDSISGKIQKLQSDKQSTSRSVRQRHNPMDFTGAVQPITQRANEGRKSYADLARNEGAGFNFAGPGAVTYPSETDSPQNDVEQPVKKKSIFATLTGTGRELDIEEIKQIDFGAVEGSGTGYYEDEEYYFGNEIPDTMAGRYQEYGPNTDRRDVSREISANQMSVFVRTALTAAVTLILVYLGFAAKFAMPIPSIIHPEKSSLPTYFLVCTVLTAVIGIINLPTVISGISSVFRMRGNSDTLPAFAIVGALWQGFTAFRLPERVNPTDMNLYFPVVAVAMLFNCIGRLTMLRRIQQNFRITASKQEKHAGLVVDSVSLTRDLMPNVVTRQPTIAFNTKADFFSDYMALSYSNKYDVGVHRSVAPVCIIGGLVVALATRFLSNDPFMAASAFAAILAISATFSSNFIENIPLAKMAAKLTPQGAMVSGNKAVETFCDTTAVVLTENELFPKGHVYLNGIKAFPGGRIDESILDAASVLCALDGSLSHVFLDMIGGNRKLLKKVDNVVFEKGMGLSGWVDGRRVLIGNRQLMHNHGVPLPEDSYERANPNKTPGNPIYLSNSGIVSARFLVEYIIDKELAVQFEKMAAKGIQLIIYTTDANISETQVWELYGYPLELVSMMPSELQDSFRGISEPRKEIPAEIVYTGKPASFIAAILATINARASILHATIIQLAQIILGYSIVALMSFMGYVNQFSMYQMIVYQLFWFVAIFIIQQTRKP